MTDAQRFQLADGTVASTRSFKPHLRKIAKKLARQAAKRQENKKGG